MNLNKIHSVYFIGIGGIGMSAIARFFNQRNVAVSGYDKVETVLTKQLVEEGISIHYEENIALLNPKADLVVYTPAISSQHIELQWYQQQGFKIVKRSDVLQMISEEMNAICVAGTHGKTTISTMIAHVLRYSSYGCNAFLGGISSNYGVNYWSNENDTAVIEADEYDRSFLKLFPTIAVVTAMDPDHLDIYGTKDEMEKCYLQFIAQVKDTLVYKHGMKHSLNFKVPKKISYSLLNQAADFYASDVQAKNGTYQFNICNGENNLGQLQLNIGGLHNVENAVATFAVASLLGIEFEKIQNAIATFKGVKRRFEYIIKNENLVYIDDYAHHPEELKMLLQSAKSLFPRRKIRVVFQPHLYSRTKDFAAEFARSLDLADEVVLLDIYPAREHPIEGVNSQLILQYMSLNNKHVLSKDGLLDWVKLTQFDVLITAGAGDIDQLVLPIKKLLESK
ncbi:MAG TPA: UDP-N-acetylmuramate--L-alanine ligase [Chitinophagaceae bacterium]|nr:MAG: UDP-N-acetylmuramate--L-alanine ligase [Bacteroidetes bacterium OLB11]HMN31752.1 UDP-N-acetylmuramate--L-alanine ligase [Chitinophagaceae bacterium]